MLGSFCPMPWKTAAPHEELFISFRLLSKNWIVSYWNLVFQHPSVLTDSFLRWLLSNPLWASAGRFCQCVLKVRVAGTVIFWQENNCLYLMLLTCFCSEKGLELLQLELDLMSNMAYLHWTSCQIYFRPHKTENLGNCSPIKKGPMSLFSYFLVLDEI